MIHLVFNSHVGSKIYFQVVEGWHDPVSIDCKESESWVLEKCCKNRVFHTIRIKRGEYIIDAKDLPFDGYVIKI
jgi:hypothetical protein